MQSKYLVGFIFIVFFATLASAADYQCVYKNQGQVNCNLAGAKESFCKLGMAVTGTTTFGSVISCSNNTPSGNGQVVCGASHSGAANQVKCSNTTYLKSGPTQTSGSVDSCSYNDCALNQVSCASAYAYQQCVPDSASPGCNKWQATNCAANAPCYSTTAAQLATCMGVPAANISSSNGVYFVSGSSGSGSSVTGSGSNGNSGNSGSQGNADGSNNSGSGNNAAAGSCYTYNGKTYCVVTSTDSAKNTGNEVCVSVGKTCVGYTAYTTDVCKYFHPSASVTTTVNGSKAGFYCNGPPQTGLACESAFNNCQVCPACNVNVTCGEEIGGLFREMYVECSGGSSGAGNSASVKELGNYLYGIFANEIVQADIQTDAGLERFCVQVTNPAVVNDGVCQKSTMWFKANQNAVTAISSAQGKKAEFLKQKSAGNISYGSSEIVLGIKIFFIDLFGSIFR
ncbi:MAG: hypothetical protein AABW99_05135 [archaeon]